MASDNESVLGKLARNYPNAVGIKESFELREWHDNLSHCRAIMAYLVQMEFVEAINKSELSCTALGKKIYDTGGIGAYLEDLQEKDKMHKELSTLEKESLITNIEYAKKSLKIAEDANEISRQANQKSDAANVLSAEANSRIDKTNLWTIISALIALAALLISIFKR